MSQSDPLMEIERQKLIAQRNCEAAGAWYKRFVESDDRCEALEEALRADRGEHARVFVGEHFHQIKGAITEALNGASVEGTKIPAERAAQLATLCMAAMGHVYPRAPWQDDIDSAVAAFVDLPEVAGHDG